MGLKKFHQNKNTQTKKNQKEKQIHCQQIKQNQMIELEIPNSSFIAIQHHSKEKKIQDSIFIHFHDSIHELVDDKNNRNNFNMEEKREVTERKGVNLEAVPKWFGMNGKKIQKLTYEESANKNIRNALLWFGFEL